MEAMRRASGFARTATLLLLRHAWLAARHAARLRMSRRWYLRFARWRHARRRVAARNA